jgi:hypothetical protein
MVAQSGAGAAGDPPRAPSCNLVLGAHAAHKLDIMRSSIQHPALMVSFASAHGGFILVPHQPFTRGLWASMAGLAMAEGAA